MIGIYKITSPSGKIYIGQSVNLERRKKTYQKLNQNKSQYIIYSSLHKYGPENHIFEIIEECTIEQLDERELYWKLCCVITLGWSNCLFCGLFDKGGGPKSEKTKDKMSLSRKNVIMTDERNKNISNSMLGKLKTKEHKQNMSLCRLGKPTKRCKPIIQYSLNGDFIKEWNKISEALNFLNRHKNDSSITACCKGKQLTAYGFKWKYKED